MVKQFVSTCIQSKESSSQDILIEKPTSGHHSVPKLDLNKVTKTVDGSNVDNIKDSPSLNKAVMHSDNSI